jgi:uncharacterized membrane protein
MSFTLKDPLVKGHPLHALMTDLPVGALTLGVACDIAGFISRKHAWRFAARVAHTGAFATGAVAAALGLWDYQAVPREHPARRVGAIHGYLNAGVLTLLLASLLSRRESQAPVDGRPSAAAFAFAAGAFATLGVSGWLGGDLVYHLGWRVAPAEHAEQLESSLRERGDTDLIDQAHEIIQQYEQEHSLIP